MPIYPRILWQNRLVGATLTADVEDTGFPVENLADWRDYVRWAGSSAASYTIGIDCGSSVSANCLAFAGHNLYSAGATAMELQCWDVPEDKTVVNTADIVPDSDKPLAFFFENISVASSHTARYWQLVITGDWEMNLEIGVLFIGNYLEMPQSPEIPYDPDQTEDHVDRSIGGGGRLLGVVNEWTGFNMEWTFRFLSQTWVHDTWLPFWESHKFTPFIFSWDSVGHGDEVHYGYFNQSEMTVPYDGYYRQPLTIVIAGIKE